MKAMICVVTVVDAISANSMPVNEFVIYRSTHNYKMKQILLVCDTKASKEVVLPDDVEVYFVGYDRQRIRAAVCEIQRQYNNKYPIVYHLHAHKSALAFLLAATGLDVRKHTLFTVHSTLSARNLKYKIACCACSLLSNYVNCVSDTAFEEYTGFVKRSKGNKLIAIPNGVDVDRIDASIEIDPRQRERKRLVYVARMVPLKNHEFLIHLMKQLPDFTLVLIGPEDKKGKIRELAQHEGVAGRIEIKGLIPRDEVFRELNRAGIYVSASLIEGLPVSVLEAMRVGLIPVISDIKPHAEIQSKCRDVTVLPLDEKKWAEVIRYYAEVGQEEFDKKCARIRDAVKREFSLDNMHSQYLRIYERLE